MRKKMNPIMKTKITAMAMPTPMPAFAPVESPDCWSPVLVGVCGDVRDVGFDADVDVAMLDPDLDLATATDDSYFARLAVGKIGAFAGVKDKRSPAFQLTYIRGKIAENSPVFVSESKIYTPLVGKVHQTVASSHPLQRGVSAAR